MKTYYSRSYRAKLAEAVAKLPRDLRHPKRKPRRGYYVPAEQPRPAPVQGGLFA